MDFARRKGGLAKSMETVVPSGSAESVRLVGTAFDYRLRMHLKADFADSDALLMGIERLRWTGSDLGSSIDWKWAAATANLLTEMPAGDEMLKARASMVLAWVDWGYRSGGKWSEELRAVADSTRRGDARTWDSLATSVDPGIASEVAALMDIVEAPRADSALCGASFRGSGFVGGAILILR